jgi:DNA-binding FadR family transcriptional regulator
MLVLTLNGITPLLTQVREQAWAGWVSEGEGLDAIVSAHAAIVEAIRAHDEEAAGRAMEAHLGQARHGLEIATERASAPSGER